MRKRVYRRVVIGWGAVREACTRAFAASCLSLSSLVGQWVVRAFSFACLEQSFFYNVRGGDTLPPFRVCLFQKLGSLFSTSRVLFGVRGGVELEGHGEVARMLCSLFVPRRWLSLTLVYQARGLFPKKEILHIF